MITNKKTIKCLLATPDQVDTDTVKALIHNNVGDEYITDCLKWGFLNKKHDMMSYFFKEYFRLGLICGFEKTNTSGVLRLDTVEKKLDLPDLFEIYDYKDELDKYGTEIHEYLSPHMLSLVGNTIACAYVPYLAISNEFSKYNVKLVNYNLEELNNLSYEARDELNLKTIYTIVDNMKDILEHTNITSVKTRFFYYKHRYDSKQKFKFIEIEKFKTLNSDLMVIMYLVSETFVTFLKELSSSQPANNSIISESKYIEKMIRFLSNMISNMSNYLINMDKEILKNE